MAAGLAYACDLITLIKACSGQIKIVNKNFKLTNFLIAVWTFSFNPKFSSAAELPHQQN